MDFNKAYLEELLVPVVTEPLDVIMAKVAAMTDEQVMWYNSNRKMYLTQKMRMHRHAKWHTPEGDESFRIRTERDFREGLIVMIEHHTILDHAAIMTVMRATLTPEAIATAKRFAQIAEKVEEARLLRKEEKARAKQLLEEKRLREEEKKREKAMQQWAEWREAMKQKSS